MKLYVGGAWQGKCDYVSGKFRNKPTIVQGDRCTKEDMKNADIINHFHEYVYRCVQNGDGMDDFAEWIYEVNPSVCIICDEVGSGIVPIDKNMRDYRELVGRVLCRLAQKSDEMERITCGVGMRIK